MSLLNYFYRAAVQDVWANQHIDQHATFELRRLTTLTGVKRSLVLPFLSTHLPDWNVNNEPVNLWKKKYYAVYEIGAYEDEFIGIENIIAQWQPISALIANNEMFAIVYSDFRILNLEKVYIRRASNETLIIAIDVSENIFILKQHTPVFIKLYSNVDTTVPGNPMDYEFVNHQIGAIYDGIYSTFLTDYLAANPDDKTMCFVNGLFLQNGYSFDTNNYMKDGWVAQYYRDPEIIAKIQIYKTQFGEFTSEIDSTEKYFICSPNDSHNMYVDDLEFFLVADSYLGATGIYLPRGSEWDVRQLTFKDWTISKATWASAEASLKAAVAELNGPNNNLTNYRILIIVRDSGLQVQNIQDVNRLTDLMNLPVAIRKQVLSNTTEGMELWTAAKLEKAAFNTWVGLERRELTEDSIREVFTFNGAVKFLEGFGYNREEDKTYLPLYNTMVDCIKIDFANGFKNDSTAPDTPLPKFPFYQTPLLDVNSDGDEFILPDLNSNGDLDIAVPTGAGFTNVPKNFGIFCYFHNGVTLEPAIYSRDYTLEDVGLNTRITWEPHIRDLTKWVRTANVYRYYTVTASTALINNGFNIYNGATNPNGVDWPVGMPINDIGMERLLIWFRGRYLIEDLDYVVHNSVVYLTGKYSWQGTGGTLHVIYAGLPDYNLNHNTNGEWGWIQKGKLSYDNTYDLYSNRHRLFTAGGKVINPKNIFAAENYEEVNYAPVDLDYFNDGTPFAIVKLPQFTNPKYIEEFTRSKLIDDIIDNDLEIYLSQIYPQATDTSPTAIVSSYDLFSPFLNRIIYEMQNGGLNITTTTLTLAAIDALVDPYKDLIVVCPSQTLTRTTFIDIHPSRSLDMIELTTEQFWFLNKVNTLYLRSKVTGINRFIQII